MLTGLQVRHADLGLRWPNNFLIHMYLCQSKGDSDMGEEKVAKDLPRTLK